MSLLLTVQGVLVVAAAIAFSLLVERWGGDPRRGGDPDRRDLVARLARGWAEVVAAREAAHARLLPRPTPEGADRRTFRTSASS